MRHAQLRRAAWRKNEVKVNEQNSERSEKSEDESKRQYLDFFPTIQFTVNHF